MTKTCTAYHPNCGPDCPVDHSPKPGSFGLARIGGLTGKLVAAGQAFAGDGSRWTHAFVVLSNDEVIEAEPGGARIRPLSDYLKMEEIAFCDTPVQEWLVLQRLAYQSMDAARNLGPIDNPEVYWNYVEALKRADINIIARGLNGVGYGYLQYVALGLVALGISPKWLERFIANRHRLICSQLVDEVYRRAGIKVFNDGRLPQQVTPGDLAIRFGIS